MNSCRNNFTNGEVSNSDKDAKAGMEVGCVQCQPLLIVQRHQQFWMVMSYSQITELSCSQSRHFEVTVMSKNIILIPCLFGKGRNDFFQYNSKQTQNVGGEDDSENTGAVQCLVYSIINSLFHMYVNAYIHIHRMQMN